MPIDEIIGFGLRAGVEVLLEVGAGQTRSAAVSRALVLGLGAAVAALVLNLVLQRIEPAAIGVWSVAGSAVLVVIGAYLVWRLIQEIRLLRHWGEPTVMASPAGLIVAKRDLLLPWAEIVSVTPENRGSRGRVRIRMTDKRQPDVFIATRKPAALASAILGVDALKDKAE